MGNCQAADAATVVIHLPGRRIERVYWCVSAREIMKSNPGHYVALVEPLAPRDGHLVSLSRLRLLRPSDTLFMGKVYRLVSFQDILRGCTAKNGDKIKKLLEEHLLKINDCPASADKNHGSSKGYRRHEKLDERSRVGKCRGGGVKWKPALQGISEIGT